MNKKDYLSIISSLSSKEEELNSHTPYMDSGIIRKKKESKKIEKNLCKKKNISESSSSISSLDSFELEFEDVQYLINFRMK